LPELPHGYDLVFAARTRAKVEGYWPLDRGIRELLEKAGLLAKEAESN